MNPSPVATVSPLNPENSVDFEDPFELIHSQFSEEAAFLWQRRTQRVSDPHHLPDDLAELDERLAAHLDGLTLLGQTGWRLVLQAWEHFSEPAEWFVLVHHYLALIERHESVPDGAWLLQRYFDALTDENRQAMRTAMRDACRWSVLTQRGDSVQRLMDSLIDQQALLEASSASSVLEEIEALKVSLLSHEQL